MALSKISGSSLRTDGKWRPRPRKGQTVRERRKKEEEEMVKKMRRKRKTLALMQKPISEMADTIQQYTSNGSQKRMNVSGPCKIP